jgi:hypothetical protein
MERDVGRRSILTGVAGVLAAGGGGYWLLDEFHRCDDVSITDTRKVTVGGMTDGVERLVVDVETEAESSYTLSGFVGTNDGRKSLSREIPPTPHEQTFEFGPYETVTAFGFHVEECGL